MTLNITVATERCIYQSADYRLLDLTTGKTLDFETQKIVLINGFGWSASVCFAGVGRTPERLDVSEWLAERIASIQPEDPFERLLEELQTADQWLSTMGPPHDRRHSFSVGAFVGSKPLFALVSNFEELSFDGSLGITTKSSASPPLQIHQLCPRKPEVFLSGRRQAVIRAARRRLLRLAVKDPLPEEMYSALAESNREAARQDKYISPACFTTHIRLTGDGGGRLMALKVAGFYQSSLSRPVSKLLRS